MRPLEELWTEASHASPQDYARLALAGIRLFNGGAALLAPRFLAKGLGVDVDAQPAVLYALRLFGVRTVLIGLQLIVEPASEHERSLQQGVLIHGSDATAAVIAGVRGQLPRRQATTAAAISLTNVLLALVAQTRRP